MNLSKHSWLKSSIVLLVSLFFGVFFVISIAAADDADGCTCFCGDQDLGAFATSSTEFTSKAYTCRSECENVGAIHVGCYASVEKYPTYNNLCWTQSQCEGYSKDRAGLTVGASFDGQSPYCVRQKGSGQSTGYCYADPLPLTLNVPILGVTQVANLATYVNLIYAWLLPAGAMMAVVMVMVAGLQYATAGGNTGRVGAAKERIFQALVGLVLLMGAYTILRFMSPDLVKLDLARVPMIKEAEVIDPSLSCEVLMEQHGFTIKPSGERECGNRGTIEAIPDDTNSGTWQVDDECQYLTCETRNQACVVAADGTGTCISCDNVNNLWGDMTPSAAICSAIETQLTQLDPKNQMLANTGERNEYRCEYSTAGINSCVAFYSDSTTKALNCAQLISDARDNLDNPCGVYDEVTVSPGDGVPVSVSFSSVYYLISDLCKDDPCLIAAAYDKKGCEMEVASSSLLEASLEFVSGLDFVQWWNEEGEEDTIYNACKTQQ